MKLTPRLQKIADLIKSGDRIVDIGTDHGYLPIYLVENNIVNKVIAADINKKPLENAKAIIKEYKYEDKIETRLGSGLEVLKEKEVNKVIIAGMGGSLITELLEKNKELTKSIETFIFQPMVSTSELRRYLQKNNFEIVDEAIAVEGQKFYEIIVAKPNQNMVFEKFDDTIGPILKIKDSKMVQKFYYHMILKKTKIYEKIEINSKQDPCEALVELEALIKTMKKVVTDNENKGFYKNC